MSAYIRITRGQPHHSSRPGDKRLAHTGLVEAVAEDGTTIDLSSAVTNTALVFKAGEAEQAVVTFLAFEVES